MRETTVPPYGRRLLTRRLPALAAAVAVLTILGPFGTFQDMGAGARLAYWGGLVAIGAVLFDLVMLTARRLATHRTRAWPPMLAAALLTVSLVQTLLVAALEHELRRSSVAALPGLLELYGYVLVVTLLVSAPPAWLELRDLGLLDGPPGNPPDEARSSESAPGDSGLGESGPAFAPPAVGAEGAGAATTFLDRIPPGLGRDLLALEMEDHYVRVHTSAGSGLILMRLRDAVAALTGVDGLQVHRSYWVAAGAVAAVERKPDGKLALRLTNGLRVPVSRSHAPAVRAAGWAERAGA